MNALKIIGILIIGVIIALVILGFFLPKQQVIVRSIDIKTKIDWAFNLVNNIENIENWSFWVKNDDSINITYGKIKAGEGASYNWTSKKSGEGVYTITKTSKNKKIVIDLDFKKQGKGQAIWTFIDNGSSTSVEEKFWKRGKTKLNEGSSREAQPLFNIPPLSPLSRDTG